VSSYVDEVISKIPLLDVKVSDIFDFQGKCLDPLAIEIIGETLDYALETSVRRLKSVAKINPAIQENATEVVLPAVKTLRELIASAPPCKNSALGEAPIAQTPKPKATRPKKDMVKNIEKAVKKEKEKAKNKEKPAPKEEPKPLSDIEKRLQKIAETDPELAKSLKEGLEEDAPKDAPDVELKAIEKEEKAPKFVAKPSDRETISVGKQFTIKNGGEKTFHVVGNRVVRDESLVPEVPGVIKLSETSRLAKTVEGKGVGDKINIAVEKEGEKGKYENYQAEIIEVKDGIIKKI
jgi:hypothetical protein